jgi:hypothetical protein
MDLVNVDEAPEQQQSLKIQARIKSAKELFDKKTESELRLVGSQVVGYQRDPLKRNLITNTADIWNIPNYKFSKYANNYLSQIVICDTCVKNEKYKEAEINYGKDKSTSNIKNHLKSHHYEIYEKHVSRSTTKDEEVVVSSYEHSSLYQKRDIRAYTTTSTAGYTIPLCKMIINNYLPLSFVEGSDFCCFVSALNSKAKIPCERTLYEELIKRKAEMSLIIDKIVEGSDRAITTDSWTSVANETYTAYTQHFIDDEWVLRSLSLDCIKHTGSTRAVDIVAGIEERCSTLGFEPSAVITDCEPSMVAAGRDMRFQHGGCIDHRLEIITGIFFDGPGVADSMKIARNVAGHYNHSSQAADTLKSIAEVSGSTKTSIDNDVVTRFWSTYKFCLSLLILKQAIISIEDRTPQSCHLSITDWLVIQSATVLLEPFMMVQELLEGERYVTISLVIPLIFALREKLKDVVETYRDICESRPDDDVATRVLPTATKMLQVFNEKFGDGTRICSYDEGPRRQPRGFFPDQICATALDPRTKNLDGVPSSEMQEVWDLLRQRVVARMLVVDSSPPAPASASASDPDPAPAPAPAPAPTAQSRTVAEKVFGLLRKPTPPVIVPQPQLARQTLYEEMVALEISRYRADAGLSYCDESGVVQNPLEWWRKNEYLYPCLAKYAKRVLAIPATSAPSERVFSVAGQTVTKKRSRLTGYAVTLLVWLKGAWEAVDEFVRDQRDAPSKKRKTS